MATYILRRTLQAIPILFGVALVSFAIVQLAPGSPIDRFRTPNVHPDTLENLIRLYGLDRPVRMSSSSRWITSFVQFWRVDAWGYSLVDGRSVRDTVVDRCRRRSCSAAPRCSSPSSSRSRSGSWPRSGSTAGPTRSITTFATIGYAIPSFLLGLYIAYIGTVVFRGAFPGFGMVSLPGTRGPRHAARRGLAHGAARDLRWPSSRSPAGRRYVRAKMLEVLNQDYVRTAKAKGLSASEGHLQARAAQRAHPGHHPVRPDPARPPVRRRHHRDHLLLAGPRPARRPGGRAA